jgi:endonuclease YncB( thermonuclease family)
VRLRLTLLLVLLAGLLAAVPAPALAGRGSCLAGQPGPTCTTWTGRVTFVNDGDTITVDFDRDRSRVRRRVRVTGINAMEQTVYAATARAGECHAVEATLRLSRLIRASGNRVRLAAQASSSISRNRLKRFIAVKVRGQWRDVGTILTAEGLALWLPQRIENAGNARYRANTQRAQALGLRLFSPTACGAGPSEASPLRLWVNWDADGSDSSNPDGEWVRIANDDPVNAVALGGWWLRDSSLRRYTFPPEAVVPPGGRLEVTVGRRGDEQAELAWGLGGPVFDNVTTDGTELGDGAYLFDPLGNLRVAMIYPCGPGCRDPLQDAIQITAHPKGPESVSLTNVSAAPVDLEAHAVKARSFSYDFGQGSVIGPGETLELDVGGAPEDDEPLSRHWGLAQDILWNSGGVARLVSYSDVTVACAAWGTRSC